MKNNHHALWRFIYKLHRYIGLISALVLIMLAVTGIALNHTEELKLDSQLIDSKTLLDWYGIAPPTRLKSFATQNHWLTQVNQTLYFDQSQLLTNENKLLGAIETNDFIVIALSHSLLVLSLQGEMIEQIPFAAVQRIGSDQSQRIIVESEKGVFYSKDGLLSWHKTKKKSIVWSETKSLPKTIEQTLKTKFRSSILPIERVLLDMHSGRFFGKAGVIIVDISGFFLIILAFSGCAIWLKHKFISLRRFLKSYLNLR